jgi:P2 family phage contractile tail tube protein
MILPENMINYQVYKDGDVLIGTANIELPSLDALTEKVKGAGIAGEIEAPVIGHYDVLTLGIQWRTITADAINLAAPVAHALDFRGSQQVYDSSAGSYSTVPVKVIVRAMPKKTSLGKMIVAGQTDSKNEFECSYLKCYIDGDMTLELDKYNFICNIGGTDYLSTVRQDLGLDY